MSQKEVFSEKQKKIEAIKTFCKFVDTYNGEMTIRNGIIFNSDNKVIYCFEFKNIMR